MRHVLSPAAKKLQSSILESLPEEENGELQKFIIGLVKLVIAYADREGYINRND